MILQRPTRSAARWEDLSAQEKVSQVSLRHNMPLRNFDIVVTFQDGDSEIFHVLARDILNAVAVSAALPSRTWSPEKLNSITSITWT